ncbi:MAG: hypothetical protein IJC09_00830 [Clostridia bacterium]|nr:hypothetical protein [Clostridia bacterium]
MEYLLLPKIRKINPLPLPHFPNRFYAVVFRLWETVPAKQIAKALGMDEEDIIKASKELGLPKQKNMEVWAERGYITTIRNAWHLLPYEQLLPLLDWNEEKLARVLKEDDFLDIKLGEFKPYCAPVRPEPLDDNQKKQLDNIRQTMEEHFSGMFAGAKPFDFFKDDVVEKSSTKSDALRMIFSYCGLYGDVLDRDISVSFPDELLKMYQATGINAIWLPAVLYQLVPFPFDESYSDGWQMRQKRLKELVKKSDKYGIKVYLYLNEPRCMPLSFFEKHPGLQGRTTDMYAAMCTSQPEVMQYLRYAVRTLCLAVPEIGGFFTINCSENLTHCKSRTEGVECETCRDVPVDRLVSDIICAISEESEKVNPKIRTIAWTWSWTGFMSDEEIQSCIDRLPKSVILMCKSEDKKKFIRAGFEKQVGDYSMSVPGPSEISEKIWRYAKEKGLEIMAKVQVNVTWECSTLPFLPVFDLVREHMENLRDTGIKHLMLGWTLGGYPSVNLKVAEAAMEKDSEKAYRRVIQEEYGEYADTIRRAAKVFSDAFREYPFGIDNLYFGPQNAGPSNLLYITPSGFDATMTCYAYDDLDKWRDTYPVEVYIDQLRKLSEEWEKGLNLLDGIPECEFTLTAWGGYALFYSSYLQADFIVNRGAGNVSRMCEIAEKEKHLALLMYDLMQKCSLFGYEAANHYYFNKGMLAEKVINCEYLNRELVSDAE